MDLALPHPSGCLNICESDSIIQCINQTLENMLLEMISFQVPLLAFSLFYFPLSFGKHLLRTFYTPDVIRHGGKAAEGTPVDLKTA